MAMSDGHSSTADRIDDAGLFLLASPYIAQAASSAAKKLHPSLAPIARAADKYQHAFHANPYGEIAGLAMVAPGVVNPLAKQVDKLLPEKTAYDLGCACALQTLGLR